MLYLSKSNNNVTKIINQFCMKFTKENALEQIKLQLGQTPDKQVASDRTLSETIDNLLPIVANDEMELADFVTKVMPAMKSVNLNVKNDVSTQVKEFKTNYKPETPPAPVPPAPPAPAPATPPAEVKPITIEDIAKLITPLQTEISTLKNQKAVESILSQAVLQRDALKPDVKNQKVWVDDAWERAIANIQPDTKPEDIVSSFKTTYEGYMTRLGANGYIPADSSQVSGKSRAQAVFEQIKDEKTILPEGAKSPQERLGLVSSETK